MDPHQMYFNSWEFQPRAYPPLKPDGQYVFSVSTSPTASTASSDLSSTHFSREETIQGLHEARRQKRREQNRAAQRKFRERKEQTEVQLRTDIIDAEKNIELLQKDNSHLLQELCSIRKENLLRRSWHDQSKAADVVKDEMAELDAISKRVTKAATTGKGPLDYNE